MRTTRPFRHGILEASFRVCVWSGGQRASRPITFFCDLSFLKEITYETIESLDRLHCRFVL